ncbi:hypothetical protein L1887_18531 [Cichorium endivia]|nr:hypothetical protein L1887_18531 [Cichorium endivia]
MAPLLRFLPSLMIVMCRSLVGLLSPSFHVLGNPRFSNIQFKSNVAAKSQYTEYSHCDINAAFLLCYIISYQRCYYSILATHTTSRLTIRESLLRLTCFFLFTQKLPGCVFS